MKKFLLSVMSLMMIALSTNAQSFDKKGTAAFPTFSKIADTNVLSGVKKADSNYKLIGLDGSDSPAGMTNFYDMKDDKNGNMVLSAIKLSQFEGYTIIGVRFAVASDLGTGAGVIGLVYDKNEKQSDNLSAQMTSNDYEVSEISDNTLTTKWNLLGYAKQHKVTSADNDILYGIAYTETAKDVRPILFGKSTETDYENMFLVYGVGSKGEGLYYVSGAKNPYVPCFQLVVLDKNGETAVIGVDGKVTPLAETYYSIDGKKLSAPQEGLNIVKMSDGTTRKIIVNKK